jgi:hypothetical protein
MISFQWVALLFLMSFSLSSFATDCMPVELSKDAKAILVPLMTLRNQQATEQFFDDGSWRGESSVSPEVEARFNAVLANRSKAGNEALAYLSTVYMGEHSGEELVCEAVNRGKRVQRLVKAYHHCQPVIGVEPLHPFVRGSGALAPKVIEAIRKRRTCVPEE